MQQETTTLGTTFELNLTKECKATKYICQDFYLCLIHPKQKANLVKIAHMAARAVFVSQVSPVLSQKQSFPD